MVCPTQFIYCLYEPYTHVTTLSMFTDVWTCFFPTHFFRSVFIAFLLLSISLKLHSIFKSICVPYFALMPNWFTSFWWNYLPIPICYNINTYKTTTARRFPHFVWIMSSAFKAFGGTTTPLCTKHKQNNLNKKFHLKYEIASHITHCNS